MKSRSLLCALSFGLAWSYFLSVFFLEKSFFGISFRLTYFFPTAIACVVLIYSGIYRTTSQKLVSWSKLMEVTCMVMVTFLSLLTCDIAYGLYLNRLNPKQSPQHALASTSRYTVTELYPRVYFPTEKSFYLHKPKFAATGEHYGELYSLDLMKSQTLAKSVFEPHPVSISIDKHGFRETTSPTETEIFSLGDSFTFGWGVSQNEVWVELLEKKRHHPIYNLGVSGLSPKQELMLLEYILSKGEAPRIRHLLWMVYEGNDLEENYETLRAEEKHSLRDLFAGTILEHVLMIPLKASEEAIVNKLQNGQITLKSPLDGNGRQNHYEIDGVTLSHPLYHSPIHGHRLFHGLYLRRAAEPRSYVMDHPNRAALEQVFKSMASLGKKYQFDVTVLIAPTDSRVHASHFQDFPPISAEPHFIGFVADLSREMGFQTVNLLPLLRPYANKELLYFRDDDHWNARGHEVVAEILARHLPADEMRH